MLRRRAALTRGVRACLTALLCAAPALAPSLAQAARPPATAPIGGILAPEPLAPRLSLSLDGRDHRVLAGVAAPIAPLSAALKAPSAAPRLRAGAMILSALALNSANYWVTNDGSNANWQLSWSRDSWRKKVITLEGVSLDTNPFETNAVHHPLAGTAFYLTARGNDLGVAEALSFAVLGSAFWEYVSEFPEKVSLNDMVITPMAGLSLGEPLHALGLLFERSAPTPVTTALSTVASPFRALHRRIEGRPRARAPALDDLGLPADTARRLELSAALSARRGAVAPDQRFALDAALIQLPAYGHPGRASQAVPAGAVTRLSAELSLGDGGPRAFDLWSATSLGGYLWQDLRRSSGGLSGHSLLAGAASAFSYTTRALPSGADDKVAAAHLAGPAIDLSLRRGALRARVALAAYADFAAVRSMAIDEYLREGGARGIKTVLANERYYFAAGLTVAPSLSVAYGPLALEAEARGDFYASIEGLDRLQERVTRDFHVADERLSGRARLSYAPRGRRVRVSAPEVEHVARRGSIGIFRRGAEETRIGARIALRF